MRPSIIFAALGMLAACGGLAYFHAGRDQPAAAGEDTTLGALPDTARAAARSAANAENEDSAGAAAATATGAGGTDASAQSSPSTGADETATVAAQPEAAKTVAQWIKDTDSDDAKTRATAIAALADAPKDQALPALKRVLQVGEPNVDRHIALRSMYSLALRDGDRDSTIRDTMRTAIYHSDDDGVTQTAQSLLDDIEAEFAERTPGSK
ncbi:hypothetical protein [Steroidobacter sp.]|uniref:hypothetical protein n=1 Tax=Steroidobacter sp. TaxID=1978227 RepID=UPI001A380A22|nr:hypothetical protein [Steroidobacter sp.]MBL8268759.1 hypothetical protein [Steroidobacter sp.]